MAGVGSGILRRCGFVGVDVALFEDYAPWAEF